jgi:hypothetical protein
LGFGGDQFASPWRPSAWGEDADWIRTIRAHPALKVQIGRDSFTPGQRFLSEDESAAVLVEFQHRHPYRTRLLTSVLGWRDLRSPAAARAFVSTRPFLSLLTGAVAVARPSACP